MGEDANRPPTDLKDQRLTVAQAADQLGISEDAVRSRIKRGTLAVERDSGVVLVLLDADRPTASQQTDHPTEDATDPKDELIDELRDRVRHLEEANRENRRIIAGLTQRIPELEAHEPSESGGRADSDRSGRGDVPSDSGSATQEPRKPWWRRLLGK